MLGGGGGVPKIVKLFPNTTISIALRDKSQNAGSLSETSQENQSSTLEI